MIDIVITIAVVIIVVTIAVGIGVFVGVRLWWTQARPELDTLAAQLASEQRIHAATQATMQAMREAAQGPRRPRA